MSQSPYRKLKLDELNRPDLNTYRSIQKKPFAVVLDNVRSLNNIGSIFRTCDAFLASEIILSGITACPPHREIQKTALGATESVEWKYFKTTGLTLDYLKESKYEIICLEQAIGSKTPEELNIDSSVKYALVLGNEVEGVGELFMQAAAQVMELPQHGTKHSLNVSIAAGIAIWELQKTLA